MSIVSAVNNILHTSVPSHTRKEIHPVNESKENVIEKSSKNSGWFTSLKPIAYVSIAALGSAIGTLNPSIAEAAPHYGPQYQDTYNPDGTFNFDAAENNIREEYRNGIGNIGLSATDTYFIEMAKLNAKRAQYKNRYASFQEVMQLPKQNKNVYYPKVTPLEMKRIVVGILNPKEEKYTPYGVEGYIGEVKSKITGYSSTQTQGALNTQYDAFTNTVLQLRKLAEQATREQWNAYYENKGDIKSNAYAKAYYGAVSKYNKAAKELVEKNMGLQIPGDFYNVPSKYRDK